MFRVLLLDDDELFNRSLARSLRNSMAEFFELELCIAQTGEEAHTQVAHATQPFDVFLIDHRLGSGPDGIEVLQNLIRLSPTSDSIVFTMLGDTHAGVRAYQAGAYRFLHKPFKATDVLILLRSLYELRKARHELDRLRVLTDIAEQVQKANSLPTLGRIIVEGALKFGFQRVRLWLLEKEHKRFHGLVQAVPSGTSSMEDKYIPEHGSLYISKAIQSRKPTIFNNAELGPTYMMQHHAAAAPVGSWVALPLWIDDRIAGLLMLDNHNMQRSISDDQLNELTLLGQQAAAAIDRIQRIESERQRSHTLAEIGKIIGHQAANADLDTLLKNIHRHIDLMMDAQNCLIALYDRQQRRINIELEIVANQPRKKRSIATKMGIISSIIKNRQPIYLQSRDAIKHYVEEKKIHHDSCDAEACSLMGVPLQLKQEVIGAIIIRNKRREYAYTEADVNLLTAIASQVAGTLKSTYLRDEMARNTHVLTLLQHASETLLGLTRQSEEWLWHVALTVCTAGYALSFNRAMLFLLDPRQEYLIGRMAIGHLERQSAYTAWEDDVERNPSFDDYLERLQSGELSTDETPIDSVIRHYRLPIHDDLMHVMHAGKPRIISKRQIHKIFSPQLIQKIGKTDYLLAPLLSGKRPIGVVILDNVFNQFSLQHMSMNYLTTWLAQVGLAYSNFLQRSANDQLLNTINLLFSRISKQTLKETLEQLSEAAATTTGADCVIVYPLFHGSEHNLPLYDFQHTVSKGLLEEFDPRENLSIAHATLQALKDKQSLLITNVEDDMRGIPQLIALRPFLVQERIRAFIMAPITNNYGEALAALFIGYRRRRVSLTEADQKRVAAFAKSCGAAIDTAQDNDREPELIRNVLTKALEPGATLDSIAKVLLSAARDTLNVSDEMVGLILRQWERPSTPDSEPHEVRRQYYMRLDGSCGTRTGQELYTGISGKALREEIDLNIDDVTSPEWAGLFRKRFASDDLSPDELHRVRFDPEPPSRTFETRSELDILIRQGHSQILGLFNIESPYVAAFSALYISRMRRLATAAGIALGMIYRQQNLERILTVTQTVVQAVDLSDTLAEVVKAAQYVAPMVSAITLWYLDPSTKQIIPGPHFGVHQPRYIRQNQENDNIMHRVMRRSEPFWVHDTAIDQRLNNFFVQREGIRSVAAFSLMVQQTPVGAIFFNYRNLHQFSDEERLLFPLLASYAATAIQDALQLEQLNAEKQRIEAALSMTKTLGTSNDLDTILASAMRILHDLFDHTHPCVLIYHATQRMLTFAQASLEYYADTNTIQRLDIDGPSSIACQVAHTALEKRQLIILNTPTVSEHSSYLKVIDNTMSQLTISLMGTEKDLLGMLVLESEQLYGFDQHDEKLVVGISQVLSVAIERVMQNRNLEFQRSVANAAGWFAEIAHDIKREIGTISKRAYLMRERIPQDMRNALLPDLTLIEDSATRLASFAKSPQESEPTAIFIDEWLIRTVESIHQQQYARYERFIYLEWDLNCHNLEMKLSTILLERALRHLIRNTFEAVQYGGMLKISTYVLNINQFCILLTNNGPDIPSDVREKLFSEPSSSKAHDPDGSMRGRGLMFVRWEIEAMGGSIALASRPGDPVTFCITLPIKRFSVNERGASL